MQCALRSSLCTCWDGCAWYDAEKKKCAVLVLAEATHTISPERINSIKIADAVNLNNIEIQKKALEYLEMANQALKQEMENNG